MPATVAEHFDKEVRTAVNNLRVIGEIWRSVHHPEHAADADDLVEATYLLPYRRKQYSADKPCMLVGLVNSEVDPDLARPEPTIRIKWTLSGEEDQVA